MIENDICIKYFSEKLKFENLSSDESFQVEQLILMLREDITDWSSKVRLNKISEHQTIAQAFTWKGMSTWWLNRLAIKDTVTSSQWFNRLVILYIAKHFSKEKTVEIHTDDKVLKRSLEDNSEKISATVFHISKSQKKLQNLVYPFRHLGTLALFFFRHMYVHLNMIKFRNQLNFLKLNKPTIWFKTSFPANWGDGNEMVDRLLGKTPLLDTETKFDSVYLSFTTVRRSDQFKLKQKFQHLLKKSDRRVMFPEAELSVFDILTVYVSTLIEQFRFNLLTRSQKFRQFFYLNDLDVSKILLPEWNKSYSGYQQFAKIQGLAMCKFFNKLPDSQIIITYGEFFPQNRACYYMVKKFRQDTVFIAIQHSMNAKNKMFTYYRSSEFNYDESNSGLEHSPYPDYFLVQGDQYKKILSEFYPKEKIVVVGSIKEINSLKVKEKDLFSGIRDNGKKLLLLAPSVGDDYKIIFSFFEGWIQPKEWQIVLCPHPMSDPSVIMNYQKKNHANLSLYILQKGITYQVLQKSDLVVASVSTIALEATLFGIPCVRLTVPGQLNLFDPDDRLNSFTSGQDFQKWLENFTLMNLKKNHGEIINDYFFKNDGLAPQRIWDFIKQIK